MWSRFTVILADDAQHRLANTSRAYTRQKYCTEVKQQYSTAELLTVVRSVKYSTAVQLT